MNDITIYPPVHTPFLAEAVCASLTEQGVALENIAINIKGAFKKTYSKDVETLHIDDESYKTNAAVAINRDGLYDILPEGLFHQTRGMQVVRSVQDAVEEHRKYKEEERIARKFFAPLEEMIFRYRVQAELSERKALYNVENEQLTNSLLDFWNIEKTLPKAAAARLVKLMPYLNTIKGNRDATAAALSFILGKDVQINNVERRTESMHQGTQFLDEMRLGVDSVIGNMCNECIHGWQINIAGVAVEELQAYVDEAPMGKLLKRCTDIFIPIDRDTYFEFGTTGDETREELTYILGYGCTI